MNPRPVFENFTVDFTALAKAGRSESEIMRVLGLNRSPVRSLAKRLKITLAKKPVRYTKAEVARRLLADGLTCAQISEKIGAPIERVCEWTRAQRKISPVPVHIPTRTRTPTPKPSTVANRNYQDRFPERRAAHKAVEAALRNGDLHKQPCCRCGNGDRVHAHHSDYSRPLDILWLCPRCHKAEHKRIKAAT